MKWRAYKYWPKSESLSQPIQVINEHEGLEPVANEIHGEVVADYCGQEQIGQLSAAINNAGMTIERFCSHKKININNLSEFNPARLQGAIKWLEQEGAKDANH